MKQTGKYKGVLMLVMLVAVLPLIVYGAAVKNTVGLRSACRQLEKRIETLQLRQQQKENGEAQDFSIRSETMFNKILPFTEKNRINIEKYTPFVTDEQGGIITCTDEYLFEGEFIPLVRVVNRIEREMNGCRIISLHFHAVQPRSRNATRQLKLKMIVQYLSTDKNLPK